MSRLSWQALSEYWLFLLVMYIYVMWLDLNDDVSAQAYLMVSHSPFVYAAEHQLYMYVDDCSRLCLMDSREPTSRKRHRLTELLVP